MLMQTAHGKGGTAGKEELMAPEKASEGGPESGGRAR